jgi:hypothetical protein
MSIGYRLLIDTFFAAVNAIGSIGTAVGIIFVIYQVWTARQQTQAALEAVMVSHLDTGGRRILDLDLAVIANPELRRWIYPDDSGRISFPADDPTKAAEALAVAEYQLDMLDTEFLRRKEFPRVAEKLPDFEPWVAQLLNESEPFCVFLSRTSSLYSEDVAARFADLVHHGKAAWSPPADQVSGFDAPHLLTDRWIEIRDGLRSW